MAKPVIRSVHIAYNQISCQGLALVILTLQNEYNYTTASFYTADCNGTDTTTETKVNGKYLTTITTIKKPKMN